MEVTPVLGASLQEMRTYEELSKSTNDLSQVAITAVKPTFKIERVRDLKIRWNLFLILFCEMLLARYVALLETESLPEFRRLLSSSCSYILGFQSNTSTRNQWVRGEPKSEAFLHVAERQKK